MDKLKTELVTGNYEDKYRTNNLLKKSLVNGFFRSFDFLVKKHIKDGALSICEVGVGEGEILKKISSVFPSAHLFGTDISFGEIEKAKKNTKGVTICFSVQDAQNLSYYPDKTFDLVVCCEVLEHLPQPACGLNEISRICKKNLLVSVPNEPIWRMLNLARFKYLRSLGNTPGHLNHWSKNQFSEFINSHIEFHVIEELYPLPWQMVLLQRPL